jgi:hypothetical protein
MRFRRRREFRLKRGEGSVERSPDCAHEQESIQDAGEPLARLILHDESVHETTVVGLEMTLMGSVGQSRLRAAVRHDPVRLEVRDPHRQQPLTPKQPRYESGRVTNSAPARAFLEADVPGPELRPVRGVRDERKATLDRDVEAICGLHAHHRATITKIHFRAVASVTGCRRTSAPSSMKGGHPATTSRSNTTRNSSSRSAAGPASGVLCTYCQRKSAGGGRNSLLFVGRASTGAKPAARVRKRLASRSGKRCSVAMCSRR